MHNNLITSFFTLRKAIGWLGMALPFALLLGNWAINHSDVLNNSCFIQTDLKDCPFHYTADGSWKGSISHYYYTAVGELFTGVLLAVGLFMFCYKGHPLRAGEKGLSDNTMTNLAGISAIGVAWFPTSADVCIKDNVRTFLSTSFTGNIHYAFAFIFFGSLALMSIVNFRRTEQPQYFGQGKYHGVFKFCGWGIFACMAILGIINFLLPAAVQQSIDWLHPTYCFEAVMLIFFGTSWLIKGQDKIIGLLFRLAGYIFNKKKLSHKERKMSH